MISYQNRPFWNFQVVLVNGTMNELFVKSEVPDEQTEIKYGLTNDFMQTSHRKNQKQLKSIPGYSVYGTSFNVCDRFNRALHHKKWWHKFGGNDEKGELGQQHGFT